MLVFTMKGNSSPTYRRWETSCHKFVKDTEHKSYVKAQETLNQVLGKNKIRGKDYSKR